MPEKLTALERVLAALGHREGDRVPFFLLATMHGAKELSLGLRDYFSSGKNVAEGQLRLRRKYRHDCLYAFFYAAIEMEAWGGETIFSEDGPPNAGAPPIDTFEKIRNLTPPRVAESPCLHRVLEAEREMKEQVGDEVPIIGVVMSPLSAPVMQLGFEPYLELIHSRPDLFERLLQVNSEFCIEWANAQLASGATAICYFDPMASPAMLPAELYLKTALEVTRRTLSGIRGPTATHLASGRCLGFTDVIASTGTAAIGVGIDDDLAALKEACRGKIALLGNLNGIEMRTWSPAIATEKVREAIFQAGPGGGFILSDQHGELPFQVSDEVLMAISDAVHLHGTYPLRPGDHK